MKVRAACILFALATRVAAEEPCPSPALPAYAHNDYENQRPLFDALRLGYRGVEADVFLVDGELRVAHDRRRTRAGRTLQSLYLDPLRDIVAHCGRVCTDSVPFLLNVEIKEASPAAYDTLSAVLRRYPDLLRAADRSTKPSTAVEVVLVGWHPPLAVLEGDPDRCAGVQQQIVGRSTPPDSSAVVRLVSLNYGKTIRWPGRSPLPASDRAWLAALEATRRALLPLER